MFNKKFWNYFWNTLKESKWLLLRYFLMGVYLTIVGIISNRLKLNYLTYYNAMITMLFFGEMIAFGFLEGFGIYINQNITDKDKSKKYTKCGFYFTIITTLILILILAIFPNFILTNIFNLTFEYDTAFYYIMLVVLFFNTLFSYYTHVLKKIGEFKIQTLISVILCITIIFGLIILLCFGKLLLIPIGIIYLLTTIFCTIFAHIMLIKNKNYSINLLNFEKLNLSKHELKTIIERALSEVIWEIGYFFISLFILKVNIITYNQYCYFENILDILNGLFFAFVSVVSIKICRCIGEEKYTEAYEHGKNSIKSTIIIWIIYALISLSCFIPLQKGMNSELQSTAFISLCLFLTVSLLRFIE